MKAESMLLWSWKDKKYWLHPFLLVRTLVRTVVAARNFNCFSWDSSGEQLFHCITNLECLLFHAQSSRIHAHLVANGQGMWDPRLFLVRDGDSTCNFNIFSCSRSWEHLVSLHNQPWISLYLCTVYPSPGSCGYQRPKSGEIQRFFLSVPSSLRVISTAFPVIHQGNNCFTA